MLSFFSQAAFAEVKVAVVDQLAAIANTKEVKSLEKKFEVEIEAEKGKLVALSDEITELEKRLQKEGDVMSAAESDRVQSDIKDKQLDRNVLIKKLQNRNQTAQQEIIRTLSPKFKEVMEKIQKDENYDLILERRATLWANEKYDITDKVTSSIDAIK